MKCPRCGDDRATQGLLTIWCDACDEKFPFEACSHRPELVPKSRADDLMDSDMLAEILTKLLGRVSAKQVAQFFPLALQGPLVSTEAQWVADGINRVIDKQQDSLIVQIQTEIKARVIRSTRCKLKRLESLLEGYRKVVAELPEEPPDENS